MQSRVLVLVVLSIILGTGAATAFEPNAGNRAYPISGHDLMSGQHYSLDSLRGKWVFLEFWASW